MQRADKFMLLQSRVSVILNKKIKTIDFLPVFTPYKRQKNVTHSLSIWAPAWNFYR